VHQSFYLYISMLSKKVKARPQCRESQYWMIVVIVSLPTNRTDLCAPICNNIGRRDVTNLLSNQSNPSTLLYFFSVSNFLIYCHFIALSMCETENK
jgi:hypothetical protein